MQCFRHWFSENEEGDLVETINYMWGHLNILSWTIQLQSIPAHIFGWSEPSTCLICRQFHPSVSLMITWITKFLPSGNDNVSWTAGVDIGPMSHLLGTQIFQDTWIQSPEAWVTPYLSSHQCGGCLLYLGPDFCWLTPKSHRHCSQHASSRTINLGFERSC